MIRRVIPHLLLATMTAFAASAHGLEANGSASGQVLVGADSLVNVIWRIDLGPTRVLSVTSTVGEFDGATQGTFGTQLRLANAVGTVTFPETVRIPASAALAAFESGAPILLRRRFDVARQIGPPVSAEATMALSVPSPAIALDVSPPTHQIFPCNSGSLTIRWTFEVDDVAPLDVESADGALTHNGTNVARLGGRLAGQVANQLTLAEDFTVPTALFAALGLDTLDYRRSFVVRGGGLERTLGASVSIDARGAQAAVAIGVSAMPTALEPERPTTVTLRWIAEAATACLNLVSSEAQVETSDGRVVATLPRPLQVNVLGTEVVDSVNLSLAVTQRLLDLGEPAVILARNFRIATSGNEPLGLPTSGLRRSVRIPWRPGLAAPLDVFRLALTFDDGEVFQRVAPGASLGAVAELTTTGRGPIRGVWEMADPASAPLSSPGPPVFRPLLVVSQPAALRGSTRITLPTLPTEVSGPHVLRFRLTSPEPNFDLPMILYEVAADWQLPAPDEPVDSGLGPPPEAAVLEAGDPVEEREVLVLSACAEKARAVETLGLDVKMRYQLKTRWPDEAGKRLVLTVLRTPAGVSVDEVLRQLRLHHPYLWVDANDLYSPQTQDDSDELDPKQFQACKKQLLAYTKDLPTLTQDDCRIVDRGKHLRKLRRILRWVSTEASACEGPMTGSYEGFLPETLSAFQIALQIDEPTNESYFLIGVAGRLNWILKILLIQRSDLGSRFFAPYNNECNRRLSFPATSQLVAGVLSKGTCEATERESLVAGNTVYEVTFPADAVKYSEGNSFAVPVVAAAFFALSKDTGWSPDKGPREFQCPP